MKRKIIIVCSIILVIALCIGTSYFFIFKDKENKESKKIQSNNNKINQLIQEELEASIEDIKESNDKTNDTEKQESNKKENISNNESTVVDKQESNNTETKKENNVVKKDNINKNETVKENKEEQTKNNSTDKSNNNESVEQEESTPEVKEEIEESNPEVEKEKQEPVPEVDEEYERLKQLYKYPTSQACYEASIEASLKAKQEDSNYRNAGCISGAYKGELVGYRIIIYYNDGTTKFYDE